MWEASRGRDCIRQQRAYLNLAAREGSPSGGKGGRQGKLHYSPAGFEGFHLVPAPDTRPDLVLHAASSDERGGDFLPDPELQLRTRVPRSVEGAHSAPGSLGVLKRSTWNWDLSLDARQA